MLLRKVCCCCCCSCSESAGLNQRRTLACLGPEPRLLQKPHDIVPHQWEFTHICRAEDEAADEPPRNATLVLLRGLAAAADTPEMATSAAPEVRRVQLVSPFSGFRF